jgi:hypothetical protein
MGVVRQIARAILEVGSDDGPHFEDVRGRAYTHEYGDGYEVLWTIRVIFACSHSSTFPVISPFSEKEDLEHQVRGNDERRWKICLVDNTRVQDSYARHSVPVVHNI